MASERADMKALRADVALIVTLAFPLVLTNFAYVALTTLDIVFLGALGPTDLAAGGLALALFNQLRAMGNGLVTGIGNLAAEAAVRQDEAAIGSLVPSGLALGSAAGLLFIGVALLLERPLTWLGQDPVVAARAVRFLAVAAPGLLPCMWFETLRHVTSGLKQPGPLLAITVVSIALSALLNYALVFGNLGLPELGLIGIACTTAVVPLFSFVALATVTRRHPRLSSLIHFAPWRADRRTLGSVWRLGVPIAATYGSEAGFFSVLTILIGTLGVHALAAQTVFNQVVYIVFMISTGISYAVSIHVSEACCQGEFGRARRLGYTALGLGITTMAAAALPYLTVPGWIIGLFMGADQQSHPRAMELAVSGLTIAALLQVFDCSQTVANGLLRGTGDTAAPFKLSLIGYWGIGLPTAYVLGVPLRLGVHGVWGGLTLGLAATAALMLWSFELRLGRLRCAAAT
jgi:MATE family multidrug resistance protein